VIRKSELTAHLLHLVIHLARPLQRMASQYPLSSALSVGQCVYRWATRFTPYSVYRYLPLWTPNMSAAMDQSSSQRSTEIPFWQTPQGLVLRRRHHTSPNHRIICFSPGSSFVSGESHQKLIWTYLAVAKCLNSIDCAGLVITHLVSLLWKSKPAQRLSWYEEWSQPSFHCKLVGDGGTCKIRFRKRRIVCRGFCESCHRHKVVCKCC